MGSSNSVHGRGPGNDDAPSAITKRPLQSRSIKQLAFSFNGGKDSTVLLHLLRAALEQCRRGEVEGAGPVPGELQGGLIGGRALACDDRHACVSYSSDAHGFRETAYLGLAPSIAPFFTTRWLARGAHFLFQQPAGV